MMKIMQLQGCMYSVKVKGYMVFQLVAWLV